MKKHEPKISVLDIEDLKPLDGNPRSHNEENLALIENSLRNHGAGRSVLLDEDNVLVAGNGTTEAAQRLGLKKVIVVETDGSSLVAVKRTNLTPEQKRQLAIIDNRASDLSAWDNEQLAALLADLEHQGVGLDSVGFTDDDLASLLAGIAPPTLDELADKHGSADNADAFELTYALSLRVALIPVFKEWFGGLKGETDSDKIEYLMSKVKK